MFSFRQYPNYLPLPPIRASYTSFLDVKNNVLARITELSNNDYDNDGSDNCDYNFGTFDKKRKKTFFPVRCSLRVLHVLAVLLWIAICPGSSGMCFLCIAILRVRMGRQVCPCHLTPCFCRLLLVKHSRPPLTS